jgi:hypothetical protein
MRVVPCSPIESRLAPKVGTIHSYIACRIAYLRSAAAELHNLGKVSSYTVLFHRFAEILGRLLSNDLYNRK